MSEARIDSIEHIRQQRAMIMLASYLLDTHPEFLGAAVRAYPEIRLQERDQYLIFEDTIVPVTAEEARVHNVSLEIAVARMTEIEQNNERPRAKILSFEAYKERVGDSTYKR